MNEAKKERASLADTARFLGYVARYAPAYFVSVALYQSVHGVLIFFEHTWSIKVIADAIQYRRPFSSIVAYIGVIAALVTLSLLFGAILYNGIEIRGKEKAHLALRRRLLAKAAAIDLANYDDPGTYNDFVWAVNDAPERMDEAMALLGRFLSCLSSILSSGVFVVLRDPASGCFVLASTLLSMFAQGALGKAQFGAERACQPHRRRMDYFARLFYGPEFAKEIRLSGIGGRIRQEYGREAEASRAEIAARSWKQVVLGFLADFLFSRFLIDGLYVGYLVIQAVILKRFSYGDAIALVNSTGRAIDRLQELGDIIPGLSKIGRFSKRVRLFLAAEPRIAAPPSPRPLPGSPWRLEFDNVEFAYPAGQGQGSEGGSSVLKGVSLALRQGDKVALVGHNGSGKTTLVKLAMRLYDPTAGAIRLNGVDIREFDPIEYRALLGTVFQDFQIFAASLAENVVLDLVDPEDGKAARSIDAALRKSGFGERLDRMPGGLASNLTREFDAEGENLSGGENQKVALSRVFGKGCMVSFLDEPSSALDPDSEYELNRTMRDASRDSGVFFISHRLSSTLMADRIVLLEGGRIVEEGGHAELMEKNGRYAEMFELQAGRYRPPVEASGRLRAPSEDSPE